MRTSFLKIKPRLLAVLKTFTFNVVVLGLIVFIFVWQQWVINFTPSMPIGLWRVENSVNIVRDGVVLVCFPKEFSKTPVISENDNLVSGSCKNGYAPLLKEVRGMPGDTITISKQNVRINDKSIHASITRTRNAQGKAITHMPFGMHVLGKDEYWVLSNQHPNSFDSRYFGPIKNSWIVGIAKPVLVF